MTGLGASHEISSELFEPVESHNAGVCSNYVPVTSYDRLLQHFDVKRAKNEGPIETWPTGLAPFITMGPAGHLEVHDGHFGLVPAFTREKTYGRRTYNARSETVATLPSFRESWKKGWRCIVPADAIFEPCYESGKAVRHRIQLQGAAPMGIAGIYRWSKFDDDTEGWTFAMLTVNADGHVLFQRMHKPADEKRMVVILRPEDYNGWLTCAPGEAPRFFQRWEGPFEDWPAPLPLRVKKEQPPIIDDSDPGLF